MFFFYVILNNKGMFKFRGVTDTEKYPEERWYSGTTGSASVLWNLLSELSQTVFLFFRFFYKHIWRQWDDEDEDDDFDYFVRCVEPRLRLYV